MSYRRPLANILVTEVMEQLRGLVVDDMEEEGSGTFSAHGCGLPCTLLTCDSQSGMPLASRRSRWMALPR